VATVRALKYHGGVPIASLASPDPAAVARGLPNLEKHVENIRKFEQPCVVAVNRFPADTDAEIGIVRERCAALGLEAVVASPFAEGARAAPRLAEVVWALAGRSEARFRPLYDWRAPIEEKIATIAREMYGAEAVDYQPRARRDRTSSRSSGSAGSRSASRRRSSRSRTTRRSWDGRRTSSSRSGRSSSRPAPDS